MAEDNRQTVKAHPNAPALWFWAPVIIGVLLILIAAAELYSIHYLRAKIIRANSWAGFAAAFVRGDEQKRLFTAIGVSEATLWIWSRAAWTAAVLLGLSGLWSALRRRFGWRMLWTAGFATVFAAGLTVMGRWVLQRYSNFDPMPLGTYIAVYLAHSLPGWLILAAWLIRRRRLLAAVPTCPAVADVNAPGASDHKDDGPASPL